MSQRHTVRGVLHVEVPALNGSREAFTFADGLHINKLSDLEVSWSQTVPNRQEALRRNLKLSKVSLRGQVVLQ